MNHVLHIQPTGTGFACSVPCVSPRAGLQTEDLLYLVDFFRPVILWGLSLLKIPALTGTR